MNNPETDLQEYLVNLYTGTIFVICEKCGEEIVVDIQNRIEVMVVCSECFNKQEIK